MALCVVQNATINLRIHHSLLNRSCNTISSSVKMHSRSASAARLCSGSGASFCLEPPLPCSIFKSTRKHRRYNNVSLSDAVSDDDFYTFEKMVLLEKYGTNLTKVAKDGTVAGPVVVEHTKEASEQVINTLCTHLSKNPCLIGESRVANTEIVREIAQQIACGKAPIEISGKQVIMLHVDRLVDSPEAVLNDLVREIKVQSDEILLFIDDIESLLRRMGKDMSVDLFESGELQSIITASTKQKYDKNKFVTNLFLPVEVPEPSITESIFILRNSVSDKMCIADEAVLASVYLSQKYDKTSRDSFLDEVFDLINDANSLIKWYKRQEVSEADIRTVVSLRYGVPVGEIAAMKDIVADVTLTDELSDKFWDENSTYTYFTERLRDRLAHSYNPIDFLEGKTRSPIDSKAVCDLLANIEDQEVVVDFDAADSSFVVHKLVKPRYASDD